MGSERRPRVLIVDDSAVMRSLLRAVVRSEDSVEVAGTAADGETALTAIPTLDPDLVLLDVEMPGMDGLETLRELRRRGHRVPVIMCSSLTHRGARVTIDALAYGATDYVAKPAGQTDREAGIHALAQELIPKIKALTRGLTRKLACEETGIQKAGAVSGVQGRVVPDRAGPTAAVSAQAEFTPKVVCIGVSTGGPAALERVLPLLPATFPLPVLVVQHMPELFTGILAERLGRGCSLKVREAAEGNPVQPGTIFIARGNWHMEVRAGASAGGALHLTQGPMENHCRPAVDVLLRSAASVYGGGVLAVILTGMGSDGLAGCRMLRAAGSVVLAQDEATSTVWGMPGAVTAAGLANGVLPLDAIGAEIVRVAGGQGMVRGARFSRQEPAA